MKRHLRECGIGVTLAVILAALIVFPLRACRHSRPVVISESPPSLADIYVSSWNFWQSYFTDPVERLVFIFRNGQAVCFTSYLDLAVEGTEALLTEHFATRGFAPADILIIIHNHLYSFQFSLRDKRCCAYFRSHGFRGHFLLYGPSRRIAELKEG